MRIERSQQLNCLRIERHLCFCKIFRRKYGAIPVRRAFKDKPGVFCRHAPGIEFRGVRIPFHPRVSKKYVLRSQKSLKAALFENLGKARPQDRPHRAPQRLSPPKSKFLRRVCALGSWGQLRDECGCSYLCSSKAQNSCASRTRLFLFCYLIKFFHIKIILPKIRAAPKWLRLLKKVPANPCYQCSCGSRKDWKMRGLACRFVMSLRRGLRPSWPGESVPRRSLQSPQ